MRVNRYKKIPNSTDIAPYGLFLFCANKTTVMKKQYLPIILFMVLSFIGLFACKKSSNPTPANNSTLTGKPFYCKIDGTEFIPNGGGRYYKPNANIMQIVGDTTFQTMEIYATSDAVGTYPLNDTTGMKFGSLYINAGPKLYKSVEGELIITKSDGTKISGTFHYKAVGASGTVNITDGEFNDIPKK